MKTKTNKNIAYMIAGLFLLIGSYNAIFINSDSHLAHMAPSYSKRLDEVYGVVTAGRSFATTTSWKKLNVSKSPKIKKNLKKEVVANSSEVAPTFVIEDEAVLQNELSLKLVEVVHPTKWKNGLANTEFSGAIQTNNGVIETLNISLPQDENISVNYAAMTGNVFEYDMNGEVYSAMIYQVDQNSFMVTLSNGPLEGVRLRFAGELVAEEAQNEVMNQNNATFGEVAPSKNLVKNQSVSDSQVSM